MANRLDGILHGIARPVHPSQGVQSVSFDRLQSLSEESGVRFLSQGDWESKFRLGSVERIRGAYRGGRW
jgi:hypothetical protein